MKNTKANQRPWKARCRSMSDGTLIIADSEHNEICVIRNREDRAYGAQNDADMANADLIERAVNEYDALCAVAEAAKDALLALTPEEERKEDGRVFTALKHLSALHDK